MIRTAEEVRCARGMSQHAMRVIVTVRLVGLLGHHVDVRNNMRALAWGDEGSRAPGLRHACCRSEPSALIFPFSIEPEKLIISGPRSSKIPDVDGALDCVADAGAGPGAHA
jgi:hypothetical protein